MTGKQRQRTVAVAVIHDRNSDSYLLWNNTNWRGYAFPMKKFSPAKVADPCAIAKEAIHDLDFPLSLPKATAVQIDRQEHEEKKSPSAGEKTSYHYYVCAIDPEVAIRTYVGHPDVRWFPYAVLKTAPNVTDSTKKIVKELVKERKVAVAVISRPARRGREYLLVWKGDRYKYFFPCTRMKGEKQPATAAVRAVRNDLAYGEPVTVGAEDKLIASQASFRFGPHLGEFTFHLCHVRLPPNVNLLAMENPLEQSLNNKQATLARLKVLPKSGLYWRWCTEKELRSRRDLSTSMKHVVETVVKLVKKKP